MTMFDGSGDKHVLLALPFGERNADATEEGAVIDLKGYNSATFLLFSEGDTAFSIEECDEPTFAVPVETTAVVEREGIISYVGDERYIRLVADVVGGGEEFEAIPIGVQDSTVASDAIDLGKAHGDVSIVVAVGTITDGTHTISLEESEDDDEYEEVEDNDPIVLDDTTEGGFITKTYSGLKQYIKVSATLADETLGGVYGVFVRTPGPSVGAVALLEHARHQ